MAQHLLRARLRGIMSRWTDGKIVKRECTVNCSACFHNLMKQMHLLQTEIIQVPIGTFMEVIIGALQWKTKGHACRCRVYIPRLLSKRSLKGPKACKPKVFRPRPSKGSCSLEPVFKLRQRSQGQASRLKLCKKVQMRQNPTTNTTIPLQPVLPSWNNSWAT